MTCECGNPIPAARKNQGCEECVEFYHNYLMARRDMDETRNIELRERDGAAAA